MPEEGGLGRRVPTDFEHVSEYPLRTLIADPSHPLTVPPPATEKSLGLPVYWNLWDQGSEGACVGFGSSAMMGITNTRQIRRDTGGTTTVRFAPRWLYQKAQEIDEWSDTPPGEGTSVRAACDVLRGEGHSRVRYGKILPVEAKWGIDANRWATTIDEIRAAIYADLAVSIGVNWYRSMDNSGIEIRNGERWISSIGGGLRGGHCVCLFRMSDKRQGFRLMNSWGKDYPPVWIGYDSMQRLLDEEGEAAVITDR